MKILVAGGSGYFGKCLREILPDNTIWLSRREQPGFVTALPDEEFTHLIDMIPVPDNIGTLAHWARKRGVKKVLYTSSGAVYGRNVWFAQEEQEPCPQSQYAVEKLAGEYAWKASGIPTVIARCFAFSGLHLPLDVHYAIGNFVRDAKAGREIVVTGKSYRSYLDSLDLAHWLHALLLDGEGVVNVGSDQIIDTHSLALMVARMLSHESWVSFRGAEGTAYVPNIAKAESMGLKRTVSLEESIRRMG